MITIGSTDASAVVASREATAQRLVERILNGELETTKVMTRVHGCTVYTNGRTRGRNLEREKENREQGAREENRTVSRKKKDARSPWQSCYNKHTVKTVDNCIGIE